MNRKCLLASVLLSAVAVCSSAQTAATTSLLAGHYQEGEKLTTT